MFGTVALLKDWAIHPSILPQAFPLCKKKLRSESIGASKSKTQEQNPSDLLPIDTTTTRSSHQSTTMSAALTAPLKTAEGYYKRAFRVLLRARHPRWNESVMRLNLAFLWASRTQAEVDACEALVAAGALTLPVVDAGLVMDSSVGKGWVALDRSGGGGGVALDRSGGGGEGRKRQRSEDGVGVGAGTTPTPATPSPTVNTTRFPFWPTADPAAPIPASIVKESKKEIGRVLAAGTLLSPTHESGETWHGAALLGEGAAGHVYLWLKTDANNVITDRMAVKDAKAAEPTEWIDPMRWRDQLPREIALSQRLAAQDDAGIVGFRGHRLNMADRRSRLYLDYADYGSAMDVLMAYYYQHGSPAAHVKKKQRLSNPSLPEPDCLPEPFIWYVFRSLVDMLVVLRHGTRRDARWRPIVHLDLCLSNLLAGPPTGEDGKPILPSAAEASVTAHGKTCRVRDRSAWPRFVMTDFDTSLFDLQDEHDPYQDNPVHYTFPWPIDDDRDEDGARGRCSPERSRIYYQQRAATASSTTTTTPIDRHDPFAGAHNKYSSATDIWQLGQIIWCLLTNLTFGQDFRPKWEIPAHMDDRVHVSDCLPYTAADLRAHFLTGAGAAPVTLRYSDELKDLVRACLAWDMADRVPLEALKSRVDAGCAAAHARAPPAELLLLTLPPGLDNYLVGAAWPAGKRTRGKKRTLVDMSE